MSDQVGHGEHGTYCEAINLQFPDKSGSTLRYDRLSSTGSDFEKISYNYFLLNKKIWPKFSGLHHSVKFLDLAKKSLYGLGLRCKKRLFNEKK